MLLLRVLAVLADLWVPADEPDVAHVRGDALGRLHEAVQAHDADLMVAVMPLLYDFDAYPFGPIHAALRTVCDDRKLACVDLLPALRTSDASSLWVHPIDHHPNETAHARIAAVLVDAVQSGPRLTAEDTPKNME